MLLQKSDRAVRDTALNRPLCMLDAVGKISEQAIAELMRKHFWGKCDSSANQYGFRAGHSTIDAAPKLKKLAALAIKKCQFGAAISLDIQNTFNSIPSVLDGTCTNSIVHNEKSDNVRCPTSVIPWTLALEYDL